MISKVYAPYVKAFSYKIDEVCQEIGAVPLCLARDAIPIYYSLMKQGVDAKLGFFTRAIMGHNDEIAGFEDKKVDTSLLVEYFEDVTCGKDVIIVDAGMYGSLIEDLMKIGSNKVKGAMFLFSKNPGIYGFLNEIFEIDVANMSKIDVDQKTCDDFFNGSQLLDKNVVKYLAATILIDSLECAHPHPIKSPLEFEIVGDRVAPKLVNQSSGIVQELLEKWWESVLSAYVNFDYKKPMNLDELLDYMKTDGFTGLISKPTPEWSSKKKFLDKFTLNVGEVYPLGR
jgi:hypothetical protein